MSWVSEARCLSLCLLTLPHFCPEQWPVGGMGMERPQPEWWPGSDQSFLSYCSFSPSLVPGVLPPGSTHSSLPILQKALHVSHTDLGGSRSYWHNSPGHLYILEMWLSAFNPVPRKPIFQPHRSSCSLNFTRPPCFVYFLKHLLWHSAFLSWHTHHPTLIINRNMD